MLWICSNRAGGRWGGGNYVHLKTSSVLHQFVKSPRLRAAPFVLRQPDSLPYLIKKPPTPPPNSGRTSHRSRFRPCNIPSVTPQMREKSLDLGCDTLPQGIWNPDSLGFFEILPKPVGRLLAWNCCSEGWWWGRFKTSAFSFLSV